MPPPGPKDREGTDHDVAQPANGGARKVELVVHPDVAIDPERLREAAAEAAGLAPESVRHVATRRRSIDARRGRVRVAISADVYTVAPPSVAAPTPRSLPSLTGEVEVVIVGAGPAGLFCALQLAERGIRAVVVERGEEVRDRRRTVAKLSQRGELQADSNYAFGEGGAGTFSDGKLYTRSAKRGPVRRVLSDLVAYGAPDDILIDARPHIGTNRLPAVITRLREHLLSAGQVVRFGARVSDLLRRSDDVEGVVLADGQRIAARAVVLATGHSAADIYHLVARHGGALEGKAFAMGLRVEHAQGFVDRAQYGAHAGHPGLGSASYRIVERLGETSVYSFCMCPGGFIVPAATEAEQQVVNGWSPRKRKGRYANSGLVVEIGPRQLAQAGFDPTDPFAALAYRTSVEQAAFSAGGGAFVAPAQRLSDLLASRTSTSLPATSYPRGAVPADLAKVLGPLADPLRAALSRIDRKIPGFAGHDSIALGVESRTSAPLRIVRDVKTLQNPSLAGLYPAAEGAGYAGGIMSAALDGIRIADTIAGVTTTPK